MKKRKSTGFFKKYINGTKGVISLFLAILMVPFLSIAGMLINAGRFNSAVATFDEALCNASNSTLGTYDEFLRSRFALMATGQKGTVVECANGAMEYTSQDFLNELFLFYMEQNLGTLSNTYHTTELKAEGLYPLSDPNVLKDAVLQTSKFTVPAKLITEWGEVDKLLGILTEPLELLGSIEDTITSGLKVATAIDVLIEKKDALETQITACNNAKAEYETAHNTFSTAASNFNTLIDNINYWTGQVSIRQNRVNELDQLVSGINSQIDEKNNRITELEKDNLDHTVEIETLLEEIEELKKERDGVAPTYDEDVAALESAKATLTSYKNQFSSKRMAAVNAKSAYYGKISTLREQVSLTQIAVAEFQSAVKDMISEGTDMIKTTTTMSLDIANHSIDKQKEQLDEEDEYYKYQETLARYDNNTEYETHYHQMVQENESTRRNLNETSRKYDNADTLVDESLSVMSDVNSDLTEFANNETISGAYQTICGELDKLMQNVSARTIPQTYSKVTYSDLYYSFTNPVEEGAVSLLISSMEEQMESKGSWTVVTAIVNFLDALFTIGLGHDPLLTVEIDESHYSATGGLPSSKDPLNALEQCIKDLKECLRDIKLTTIPKALRLMGDLVANLIIYVGEYVTAPLGEKLLVTGYVSYNTANRITYEGSSLSGAKFDLPPTDFANGYTFAGAQTEYIYGGSMDEKENQNMVFLGIFIERIVLNLFTVFGDTTIETLAVAISAATLGVGGWIFKFICLIAEAMLDTIILCNGGEIPILKNFVYLTPPGMPKLLDQIWNLKIPEDKRKEIYEDATESANKFNENIQNRALEKGKYIGEDSMEFPRYDEYTKDQNAQKSKVKDAFTWDYTKSLQLLLLLFKSTDTMVTRLADIIQMEGTYKALHDKDDPYTFNLDNSFTQICASGKFSSRMFVQVSEDDILNSKNRVVYNGY